MSNPEVAAKRLVALKGLREHRHAAGVSQEAVARYANVSLSAVRRYEHGTRVMPPMVASKVARALGQLGATGVSPAGLVLASARDVVAAKSAEGAPAAIDTLGALKVDGRPDAETASLIDMLIAALAELRGQAYQHAGFSDAVDQATQVPMTVEDNRPLPLDVGNAAHGAPDSPALGFGITAARSRDGLGRSRAVTKAATKRDGLGRARPETAAPERDGMGRRRKGQ